MKPKKGRKLHIRIKIERRENKKNKVLNYYVRREKNRVSFLFIDLFLIINIVYRLLSIITIITININKNREK